MYNIKFRKGNIAKSDCECIVNAANKSLLGGGGVDGAIHRAAGPQLYEECKTLGGCETGEAKITKGHNLKAKWVIHTVGPIYSGKDEDEIMLSRCYSNSLDLARQYGIRSISFPAISTGAYGYPMHKAIVVAFNSAIEWLNNHADYDICIEFCCYDEDTYVYYLGQYDLMTTTYEARAKKFNGFINRGNVRIKDAVEMHLAEEPFEKIKRREKTVEIRLFDEKRKAIKIGEKVVFYKGEEKDEWIVANVIGLHRFERFVDLFQSDLFGKTGSGNMSLQEAADSMYKYYTKEQEQDYQSMQ